MIRGSRNAKWGQVEARRKVNISVYGKKKKKKDFDQRLTVIYQQHNVAETKTSNTLLDINRTIKSSIMEAAPTLL